MYFPSTDIQHMITKDNKKTVFSDRSDGLKRNSRHIAWGRIYNVIRRQFLRLTEERND
jgi:hypothetical protein